MCGRYYVDDETAKEIEKLVRQLDERFKVSPKRGDIRPSQRAAVICSQTGDTLTACEMLWGFPRPQKSGLLINARSETVCERPLFRESMHSRRCIIPASHYYEWNSQKEKAAISSPDAPVLFMAGIYNTYEGQHRFVIITTEANSSVRRIHSRMPLILERPELDDWIFDEKAAGILLKKTPAALTHTQDYEQLGLFKEQNG